MQPDDDQAVRLMEAACRGSDEALRVPLPGTGKKLTNRGRTS